MIAIIALYNDNVKNELDFGMWNGRTSLPEHDHLQLWIDDTSVMRYQSR